MFIWQAPYREVWTVKTRKNCLNWWWFGIGQEFDVERKLQDFCIPQRRLRIYRVAQKKVSHYQFFKKLY